MSVLFSLRGNTLAAYRAVAGGSNYTVYNQSGAPTVQPTACSDTGLIGSSVIDLNQYGWNTYLCHAGFGNFPDGTAPVSVLMRVVFGSVGAAPSINNNLMGFVPGDGAMRSGFFFQQQAGTANWLCRMYDYNGNLRYNATPFTWYAASTQAYDLLFTWDGTNNSGACNFYIDNSLMATWNPTVAKDSSYNQITSICLGGGVLGANTSIIKLDEFVVWDEVVTPASVALESGTTTALAGSSRTSFVAATRFDPDVYSDPGIANVLSGTSYIYEGNTQSGTYNPPTSTAPGVANVLSGTGYTINDTSYTGTYNPPVSTNPGASNVLSGTGYTINDTSYTGSYNPPTSTNPGASNVLSGTVYIINDTTFTGSYHDKVSVDPGVANVYSGTGYTINDVSYTGTYNPPVSTDPGVANVLSGTSYIINDTTYTGTYAATTSEDPGVANVKVGIGYTINDVSLTGTLPIPVASTGSAGTVPINELKEQIRYVLTQNNTTTGYEVIDLSANLSTRVQKVAKVNPEKLMMRGNELPAVTVFTSRKSAEPQTISKNMANGKRKATVTLTVAGLVWVPYTTNNLEDPADDDIENLMENVERILRSYDSLSGNANWHFPTGVTYHSASFDEQTHLRVALMDLEVTTFY